MKNFNIGLTDNPSSAGDHSSSMLTVGLPSVVSQGGGPQNIQVHGPINQNGATNPQNINVNMNMNFNILSNLEKQVPSNGPGQPLQQTTQNIKPTRLQLLQQKKSRQHQPTTSKQQNHMGQTLQEASRESSQQSVSSKKPRVYAGKNQIRNIKENLNKLRFNHKNNDSNVVRIPVRLDKSPIDAA